MRNREKSNHITHLNDQCTPANKTIERTTIPPAKKFFTAGEVAAAVRAVRRGGNAANHDERRISSRQVNLGSCK